MNRQLILTLTLALGLSPWIRAADAPVALDPKVNNILTTATSYYAARKSLECDITSATNISMTGMKQEMESTFHLALVRPNSFAFTLQSGMMGGSLVSDGKTLVTLEPVLKKYTSKPAPSDISDLLDPMNFMLVGGGLPLGFEPFLRKDPFKSFEQNLKSSQDLGMEKLGDAQAHHVQLTSLTYVTDLWIADGPSPLLLQASVIQDMSESLKHMTDAQKKLMPAGMSSMSMSRTTTFTNWKLDQPVAADTFVFHPPDDAKLVTDFLQRPPPLTDKKTSPAPADPPPSPPATNP